MSNICLFSLLCFLGFVLQADMPDNYCCWMSEIVYKNCIDALTLPLSLIKQLPLLLASFFAGASSKL